MIHPRNFEKKKLHIDYTKDHTNLAIGNVLPGLINLNRTIFIETEKHIVGLDPEIKDTI